MVLLVQGTVDDMRQAHGLLRVVPVTMLARWCFRLATVVAVPYEGIGRWVGSVAGPGLDPVLLPNRIPAYLPDQEDDGSPTLVQTPYAIFVGSLSPWQGLDVLIEAVGSERWPDGVRLAVVGDGPERWRVQGRAEDGVTWLGHLPPRQARPLLRGALCSVSPKAASTMTDSGWSPFKLLEALDEEVPYIASDVPGQREFVQEHGGGVLVTPDDPEELARTVARLHTDDLLRARLRAQASESRNHLGWGEDVETFSRALGGDRTSRRTVPSSQPPGELQAFTPYGVEGASPRIRVHEWVEWTGVHARIYPYVPARSNSMADVVGHTPQAMASELRFRRLARGRIEGTVMVNRRLTPFGAGRLEAEILQRAEWSVYDFDDAMWLGSPTRLTDHRAKWEQSVRHADRVVAGSAYLAERAAEYSDQVQVIPSCVDPGAYDVVRDRDGGAPFTAVWVGSPATEKYLWEIETALVRAHQATGLRLVVISAGSAPLGRLDAFTRRVPWSTETVAADLADAHVGLMPLPDDPWSRGKCAYKLLQYGAARLPVVGSPVGANNEVLQRLGGWAATTQEEWLQSLRVLHDLPTASRDEAGRRARSGVEQHYSFAAWEAAWTAAITPGAVT
ncbi:glycosyltransferase [Ornithinimicrobium sp. W1679]|uniref:glycosyltransferase n=1 Tax=Ornithinimicrobium sp. W1679 TaxID=3418770 RepID=UPI003CF3B59F